MIAPPLAPPPLDRPPRTSTAVGRIADRAQRERDHFNALTSVHKRSLVMAASNIRRYDHPPADTVYPLEYAFHLLGEIAGRRVLNIGCGEGFDAVILGALGARVTALDISDAAVALTKARATANSVSDQVRAMVADAAALPVASESIDSILAAAVMHHVDIPKAAAELRRVLRPGGVAVFIEPLADPHIVGRLKRMLPLPQQTDISEDERPLTKADVRLISLTIGSAEVSRPFCLITRLVRRLGVRRRAAAYRFDRWALSRCRWLAALASPTVWSVRKPRAL